MTISCLVAYTVGSRGIGKDGNLPWYLVEDMKRFRDLTIGNVVVMGSKTFFSLPNANRPLPSRTNIVLTRSPSDSRFDQYRDRAFFCDLEEVRSKIEHASSDVFVIGGRDIYEEFLPICSKVYATVVYENIECDTHFPMLDASFQLEEMGELRSSSNGVKYRFLRMDRTNALLSADYQYAQLARKVLQKSSGKVRNDRTGTGTLSIFGEQIRIDISKCAPVLTTKRVPWKSCIEELLWFMKGQTDANILKNKGVNIWNGNSSREFLDKVGLERLGEGDCGANYSFQWRFFGQEYNTCYSTYIPYTRYDQLNNVLKMIRTTPTSRRIFMSSWNPLDLENTVLPPCHVSAQFYVDDGVLSCHVYQRSCDVFLGLPWNIFSYSTLTHIFAKMADLVPGELIMSFGDVHLYTDHLKQINEQLSRVPLCAPVLQLHDSVKDKMFEELSIEDFNLIEYNSHPSIKGKMSV